MENANPKIVVTLEGMVIEVREVQFSKEYLPIDETLEGILTDVRAVQPLNTLSYIDVTLAGIVTEERPLQPSKALPPMDVTPSGMTTPVIFVFPENAPLLIAFIGLPYMLDGI